MLRTSRSWCGVILLVFLFFNVLLTPALATGFPFKRIPFDGHVHTWYSDEDPMTFKRSVESAAKDVRRILGEGSAFAVTDHTDVVDWKFQLRSLFTRADWVGRAEEIEKTKIPAIIIPGLELTVGVIKPSEKKDEGHFLVYGLKDYCGEVQEAKGLKGLKAPFKNLTPDKLEDEKWDRLGSKMGHLFNPGDKILWEKVWEGDPPRKDVTEALKEVGEAGGFGYIAHPNGGLFGKNPEIKGKEDRDILKQAVDRVFDWGATDIGEGLLVGAGELEKESLPEVRKAIILLTDGVQTADPYEEEHLHCRDKGIRVYTIGLGSYTDPELLKRIAQETGGRYFEAPDAQALAAIYQELSAAVAGGAAKERQSEFFTAPGETRTRAFTVEPGTLQATFGITWSGSDFDLILVRPDGRELTPESPDPDYSFVKGPTYAYYIVDNPEPGEWTYVVTAREVPPGGEDVNLSLTAVEMTPPEVTIEGFPDGSLIRQPVTVSATACDPDGLSEFYWFLDNYEVASVPVEGNQSVVEATYALDPGALPDGTHIITAWAADSNFTSAGADLTFIIDNAPPVADAGPDREVRAGEEVIFDATGSRDAAAFFWDFGDGTEEASLYPYGFHIYNAPGNYTVTLTVYDDAGNSAADTCRVLVRPAAAGGGGGGVVRPYVSTTDPADKTSGVPVDKEIKVVFSESVSAGADLAGIALKDASGKAVEVSARIEGSALYIKPKEALAYGAAYTVVIPPGR